MFSDKQKQSFPPHTTKRVPRARERPMGGGGKGDSGDHCNEDTGVDNKLRGCMRKQIDQPGQVWMRAL